VRATALAAAALVAAAGLAGALAIRETGGVGSGDELAALRARLDEELAARERLEEQVARLGADLAALRERAAAVDEADVAPYAEPAEEPAALEASRGALEDAANVDSPGHVGFDEQKLAGAGLPERDVADLRRLFEEVELERLYLQNQATREGWPRGRLAGEQAALDDRLLSVRDEYGEDAYDWFLYASGRTNRVVVEGVLGGSAAEEAGLRAGDVIVRYDGERIWKPGSLIQGTLGGRLNETVELEVERGGSRERVSLPRGPIGVRLGRRSVEPVRR
jgi:hypothetical protein